MPWKIDRWHCLHPYADSSSTSLMEIWTYDPRSMEPLLYNLSYPVMSKTKYTIQLDRAATWTREMDQLDSQYFLLQPKFVYLNISVCTLSPLLSPMKTLFRLLSQILMVWLDTDYSWGNKLRLVIRANSTFVLVIYSWVVKNYIRPSKSTRW